MIQFSPQNQRNFLVVREYDKIPRNVEKLRRNVGELRQLAQGNRTYENRTYENRTYGNRTHENHMHGQQQLGASVLDVLIGKDAAPEILAKGLDKFFRETKGGIEVESQLKTTTFIAYAGLGLLVGIGLGFIIKK